MNHYKFPIIRKLSDVLPHIKDRNEFIVAERADFLVVNYMVSMADTFDMFDETDLSGAIRRECRGLIFYKNTQEIMSRPFHKFFNVNEKEETQAYKLDMRKDHKVLEKKDGSMIRPIFSEGKLRLATKMGITDISVEAEQYLTETQKIWLGEMCGNQKTPILEYVSPTNKIVVEYSEPKLILLAIRDTITGEYEDYSQAPFELVPSYGSIDNIGVYLENAKTQTGREGDVIRFKNGHMYKIKNDWYINLHRIRDELDSEKNICKYIVEETLDDLIPHLDESGYKKVKEYELFFEELFNTCVSRLEKEYSIVKTEYNSNKKDVALKYIPTLNNPQDASILFNLIEGKNLRDLILRKVKASLNTNVKYDALIEWMKGN